MEPVSGYARDDVAYKAQTSDQSVVSETKDSSQQQMHVHSKSTPGGAESPADMPTGMEKNGER